MGNKKGNRSGRAKLTDKQVIDIKRMIIEGYRTAIILAKYKDCNICKQDISNIRTGKYYSDLDKYI